ncbi:MAG: phosphoglucosamine mutase [Thermoplasmata archaeon]|nr:phosphoglucosamine mutase [Thermoplasmata archaeon]
MARESVATPPGSTPPHLFGSDGIRGVVGELYTPEFLADLASAYATWLGARGTVLLARDFRTTSPGMAYVLGGTLQMLGLDVVELGPMPTPCLQFNVRACGAQGGLMVTASHNPPQFNGVKFAGPKGLEIPPEAERAIEEILFHRTFRRPDWKAAGSLRSDSAAVGRYVTSIRSNVDRDLIARQRPSVVLDPGNGTSTVTSPTMFRELGCRVLSLNANPDGVGAGRNSEPSEENLADLRKLVPLAGASLGVAHDGDADRIAFIDEKGGYVSGDVMLGLLARYMLQRHPGGTIVTSITSSTLVREVVEREGGKFFETRSGSLPVAIGMEATGAIFGGEENGHCYWPAHQNAPDGAMTSAMMLELLARSGRPLSELVAEMPAYRLLKRKVDVDPRVRTAALEHVRHALTAEAQRVETTDGVKAYFPEGWVLVRPSGTEPLFRVFAESRTAAGVQKLSERGIAVIREFIDRPTGTGT